MSSFEKIFKGQPTDPIQFIYNENWLTVSSIGSIFMFALTANFKENIFDKIFAYILPPQAFDYMTVEFPDTDNAIPLQHMDPNNPTKVIHSRERDKIYFGKFVRECLIWIFMILFLYLASICIRWPMDPSKGISLNTK